MSGPINFILGGWH